MGQYIVKRGLFSILVLWIISLVVFSAVRLIPGDVCKIVLATPDVDKQQCDAIRSELGLDKPLVTQYLTYMGGVLHGDLGTTLISKRDVAGEIKSRIPLTVELTVLATLLSLCIALPIGVISAVKQDSAWDYGLRLLTIGWLSIPGILARHDADRFSGQVVALQPTGGLRRLLGRPAQEPGATLPSRVRARTGAEREPGADYALRIARSDAPGLCAHGALERSHRTNGHHSPQPEERNDPGGDALRHSVRGAARRHGGARKHLQPSGLGTLTLSAVTIKDYPEVQGLVLFFATILILINLLVDLSYAWFDPRIRYN